MRALVMAAGLGTRLKPLTDSTPKPLVPLLGRPMVAHVLDQLAGQGIRDAILNIHYFPDQMRAFVADWNRAGRTPRLEIQDESQLLLDSGGSIPVAAPWLFADDSTALVCNADVIARPDLRAFRAEHERLKGRFGVECSLALSPHAEVGRKYNGVARDAEGRITRFVSKTGSPDPSLLHFPGYYLLERNAVSRMPAAGAVFGVKETLWNGLAAEGKLGSFLYDGIYLDLGTPDDLRAAERVLAEDHA